MRISDWRGARDRPNQPAVGRIIHSARRPAASTTEFDLLKALIVAAMTIAPASSAAAMNAIVVEGTLARADTLVRGSKSGTKPHVTTAAMLSAITSKWAASTTCSPASRHGVAPNACLTDVSRIRASLRASHIPKRPPPRSRRAVTANNTVRRLTSAAEPAALRTISLNGRGDSALISGSRASNALSSVVTASGRVGVRSMCGWRIMYVPLRR